jgi:hypothetical protein
MTPAEITAILGIVQLLGTQIGSLMALAKGGGATDEQLQAAYDTAHAAAMAYVPLTPPTVPDKPPVQ